MHPPNISTLPYQEIEVSRKRSPGQTKERNKSTTDYRAKKWLTSTPSFDLPDIDLASLEKRPKNNKADRASAAKMVQVMNEWPADACSGRWYDKKGRLMVAVFADNIVVSCQIHAEIKKYLPDFSAGSANPKSGPPDLHHWARFSKGANVGRR